MELIRFNQAYQAIMLAKSVDEVKEIRDKMEALRLYLKQQGESLEMQNACAEIKLRAERRAGELLKEMPKNEGGGNGSNQHQKTATPNTPQVVAPKLSDMGITYSQSSRFQSIASIPVAIFEAQIIETKAKNYELTSAEMLKTAKELRRKAERDEQIKAIEEFEHPQEITHFQVISIDPPWSYDKRPTDITHRAASPYPSMTIEEISRLNIPADDDCILWLWTTNAFMEEAHQIVRQWGFEKKTILTWVKNSMGLGDWLRGQTEHCLMCIKGKPIVNLTNQTTVIYGPLREHSRKPDEFYQLVESLCYGQKLEMFAREKRDNWTSYGIENKF